jgi:hypothetical protein
MFLLIAIADMIGTLAQIGAFEDSVLAPVLFCAFAIGVLVFWHIQRKRKKIS